MAVGSFERYARRETASLVGLSIKFLAVILVLFWPIAVVVNNIHSTVWDRVAGVPFELSWLAVLALTVNAIQKSKKNRPVKGHPASRTPTIQPDVTVVVHPPGVSGRAPAMVAALALAALVTTGCNSTGQSSTAPPTTLAPATPPTAVTSPPNPPVPTPPPATTPVTTAPPVTSSPPATTPAPAPSSGPCHARGSGLYMLPDPTCAPGVADPGVTQANINSTICKAGWTDTVRPPESYTEILKREQMVAYGETNPISDYEEDHVIPLELGGSPTSPENLWPEPGASPNPKDAVERAANTAVCDGRMTLVAAQRAIARDWITFGQQLGVTPASPAVASSPPASGTKPTASCTVMASFNSQYNDYDVYVHSNQPDQTATVTTSGVPPASWRTDSSGYADVYLKASRAASGQRVTASVAGASCSGTL